MISFFLPTLTTSQKRTLRQVPSNIKMKIDGKIIDLNYEGSHEGYSNWIRSLQSLERNEGSEKCVHESIIIIIISWTQFTIIGNSESCVKVK